MRVFAATFMTETNTFSPFLTGMQNFESSYLTRGGNHGDDPSSDALVPLRWKAMSEERGWEFVESIAAFAQLLQANGGTARMGLVRARIVYYMQMGYYIIGIREALTYRVGFLP